VFPDKVQSVPVKATADKGILQKVIKTQAPGIYLKEKLLGLDGILLKWTGKLILNVLQKSSEN